MVLISIVERQIVFCRKSLLILLTVTFVTLIFICPCVPKKFFRSYYAFMSCMECIVDEIVFVFSVYHYIELHLRFETQNHLKLFHF